MPLVHADPDEMAALALRIEGMQAQCREDLEGMLDGLNGPLADAWQDARYNTFSMELAAQLDLLRDELNALSLLADSIKRRRQPLLAYLGQESTRAMGEHGQPDVSEYFGAAPLKRVGTDVLVAAGSGRIGEHLLSSALGDVASSALMDGTVEAGFALKESARAYGQGTMSASEATANVVWKGSVGLCLTGPISSAIGSLVSFWRGIPMQGPWEGAVISVAVSYVARAILHKSGVASWATQRLSNAFQHAERPLSKLWEGAGLNRPPPKVG